MKPSDSAKIFCTFNYQHLYKTIFTRFSVVQQVVVTYNNYKILNWLTGRKATWRKSEVEMEVRRDTEAWKIREEWAKRKSLSKTHLTHRETTIKGEKLHKNKFCLMKTVLDATSLTSGRSCTDRGLHLSCLSRYDSIAKAF